MPDPITGLIAGGTAIVGSSIQSRAARRAGAQQASAAEAGIEEQRRQFDALQALLRPYVEAGTPALQGQQALLGLLGPEEQAKAIQGIESGAGFQALARQGETAMLQQASATGGLRGGNIQGALAQFRPQLLQSAIDEQYQRLGGLTALGQQSAAGVGTAGIQSASNISNLLQQQGAARAGATLGSAAPWAQALALPAQFVGIGMGMGRNPMQGLFGGARPQMPQFSGWE
jgi:hypothetical protein